MKMKKATRGYAALKKGMVATLALLGAVSADAQWVQTDGPTGGQIMGLIDDGDRLIAAVGDGIYHYENDEWNRVGAFPDAEYAQSMRRGELFAQRGDVLLAHWRGHIFRSEDDGATWSHSLQSTGGLLNDANAFYALEVDPGFQSDTRIFRSEDGENWEETGAISVSAATPVLVDGKMISVLSYGSTLLLSEDQGATWEEVTPDFPFADPSMAGTFIFNLLQGEGAVYAVVGNELFASNDGESWTNITGELPADAFAGSVMSHGGTLLLKTPTEEYYRYDGTEWVSLPVRNANQIMPTDEGLVYTTYNGGVYLLDEDAGTSASIAEGLVRTSVTALGAVDGAVLANATGGLHRSEDGGDTWEHIETFDGWTSLGFYTHGDVIYALGGTLHRSTDRGDSWEMIGPRYDFEIEDDHNFHRNITSIVETDDAIYLGVASYQTGKGTNGWSDGGIFRSDDGGETWERAEYGLPYGSGFVSAPVADLEATDNAIVATTDAGIYRSTNGGGSWHRAMAGLSAEDLEFGRGGTLYRIGDDLYLQMRYGFYLSTDDGATWSSELPPLPSGIEWTITTFSLDDEIYMQTYNSPSLGVFEYSLYKFDGTEWVDVTSWQPEGLMFNTMVRSGDYYYAGTNTDGVWRLSRTQSIATGSGTTGVADEMIADGITLTGAPNPADGAMQVDVTLPEATDLRISLVSIFGKEMSVLHDGHVDAGTRSFAIETDELPSGTYYVRLTTSYGASKVVPVQIAH